MYYVEDLVSQFSGINITAMRVVGYVGYVQGPNVGDIWKALEEMMLGRCQYMHGSPDLA